jgi:hypothetical protein
VPLVARLEHPGAGARLYDVVAKQRAERSLEDVGVLVLSRMAMEWRCKSTRRQRMVDDGEALVGLGAFDLPGDAEPAKLDVFASVCRNRDSVQLRAHKASFWINSYVY